MEEPIVTYKPLSTFYALAAILAAIEIVGGYLIALLLAPVNSLDLLAWAVWYLTLPVGVSLLGAYLGWKCTEKDHNQYGKLEVQVMASCL